MEDKNVLVVGGGGFIGSNLVKMLLADKAKKVVIVDNLLSAEKSNIPHDKKAVFIEGSITDEGVLSKIKDEYDFVFHLATYHGNQSSIHDPLADHDNNTYTTLRLFDHLKNFKKIKKIVYSSAGCSVAKKTYGTAHATKEDAPIELHQDSPYSISKIIGEFYSAYYHKQHGLPVVRARFQNVYGPGEILGAGRWRGTPATVWRNVTPTFIYKSLKGESLPLMNGGDASRDFIYVEDICRGLVACALRGLPGDVYNIASGKETTIFKLAQIINKLTGNSSELTLLPKRSWDTSGKRYGSPAKIKMLRNHGSKIKYYNDEIGISSRLDGLQAAILNAKLKHLNKWNKARNNVAQTYNKLLEGIDWIRTPNVHPDHVFHQYTVRVKNGKRDELKKHLAEKGIQSMIYYPIPLHLLKALEYLGVKKGSLPEAEKACREVLSLPIYPEFSNKLASYVARTIKLSD